MLGDHHGGFNKPQAIHIFAAPHADVKLKGSRDYRLFRVPVVSLSRIQSDELIPFIPLFQSKLFFIKLCDLKMKKAGGVWRPAVHLSPLRTEIFSSKQIFRVLGSF
jgi:hypothetical protein